MHTHVISRRTFITGMAINFAALALAGCSSNNTSSNASNANANENANTNEPTQEAAKKTTFTDDDIWSCASGNDLVTNLYRADGATLFDSPLTDYAIAGLPVGGNVLVAWATTEYDKTYNTYHNTYAHIGLMSVDSREVKEISGFSEACHTDSVKFYSNAANGYPWMAYFDNSSTSSTDQSSQWWFISKDGKVGRKASRVEYEFQIADEAGNTLAETSCNSVKFTEGIFATENGSGGNTHNIKQIAYVGIAPDGKTLYSVDDEPAYFNETGAYLITSEGFHSYNKYLAVQDANGTVMVDLTTLVPEGYFVSEASIIEPLSRSLAPGFVNVTSSPEDGSSTARGIYDLQQKKWAVELDHSNKSFIGAYSKGHGYDPTSKAIVTFENGSMKTEESFSSVKNDASVEYTANGNPVVRGKKSCVLFKDDGYEVVKLEGAQTSVFDKSDPNYIFSELVKKAKSAAKSSNSGSTNSNAVNANTAKSS